MSAGGGEVWPPIMPPAPDDRSDLVAMGRWVQACLERWDQLTWRTVVGHLVDEVERLRGQFVLDEHDQAVYSEAFRLAEAVRLFLARRRTHRVLPLLDDDVVKELIECADRMWLARTQRVGAARARRPES